jgi:hypothetical protein
MDGLWVVPVFFAFTGSLIYAYVRIRGAGHRERDEAIRSLPHIYTYEVRRELRPSTRSHR